MRGVDARPRRHGGRGRALDARVPRSRDARALRPRRCREDRPAVGAQRARARAGDPGGRDLLRAAGQVDHRHPARLAGVVDRAAREPARGPVHAGTREAPQGLADGGVRLLPRLPHRPLDHPPLPADRPEPVRVRPELGDAGGGRRRAPRDRRRAPARRQGRARWALARRRRGHGVRDLGCPRPPRRPRPVRPRVHRRRELPGGERGRRRRGAPAPAGRLAVRGFRRHPGAAGRGSQRDRVARRPA